LVNMVTVVSPSRGTAGWRRRLVAISAATVATVVVLLVGLIAYAGISSHQPVTLPALSGQYLVGRAVYDWSDPSRLDPFAPGGTTPRELSTWVRYPADPASNATPSSYLPADWAHGLAVSPIQSLVQTPPSLIRPHSFDDAPLAGGSQSYSVLLFEPGLGLAAYDYTTTLEDIASHGYVVFAINPTYSTDVVLSGGRVIHSVPSAGDNADLNQLTQLWAADMLFAAKQVSLLNTASSDRFAGRLDLSRIGFFGHSLGGAAATEACKEDSSCAGAVDFDGSLFGKVLSQGIGKPFLFIGNQNTLDAAIRSQLHAALQNELPGQGHVITINGTGHENFTDRGIYFFLFLHQLGVVGSIDGARALTITDTYVLAFFEASFGGNSSPLLAGPSSDYPEVQFETP
jgi:dienelactone hydrolase